LRPSSIDVLIGDTSSAGEIVTIALKTLQKTANNTPLTFRGIETGGSTTMIGWKVLSHGGITEYPVGHMTDFEGTDYSRGISPDVEIENPFSHEKIKKVP
jgi:C-terminal processing protease CtpA/Prc